jgi:hypothetical protein
MWLHVHWAGEHVQPKQQATPLGTLGSSLFIDPIPLESFYETVFVHGPYLNLFPLSSFYKPIITHA